MTARKSIITRQLDMSQNYYYYIVHYRQEKLSYCELCDLNEK